MDKYLLVEWGPNMVFRDSLQFLCKFLKQLAASLSKVSRVNFVNLHYVVTNLYPEADVELLKRKGAFCYDDIDSVMRFDEFIQPPRKVFVTKLGNMKCSLADYAHA